MAVAAEFSMDTCARSEEHTEKSVDHTDKVEIDQRHLGAYAPSNGCYQWGHRAQWHLVVLGGISQRSIAGFAEIC